LHNNPQNVSILIIITAAVGFVIVQRLLHVCSPLADILKQTQRLDENLVTVQKQGTRAFSNQQGHIL
jgi:hypothetical protein